MYMKNPVGKQGPIWAHFGSIGPLINLTQSRIDRFWANGARRGPKRGQNRVWALLGPYGALIGGVLGNDFSDFEIEKRDVYGF